MFDSVDDLTDTLEDYLERADLRARVATFIRLAETRLDRRLNLADNEAALRLPISAGLSPLPDDYRAWRAVSGPSGEALEYLSPHAFARTGGAGAFTIVGSLALDDVDGSIDAWTFGLGNPFLRVAPTVSGPLTLVYRQGIPPLGPERASNWLLAKHPDLYLYASLLEAEPFLRNDTRIATWRAMLEAALDDLAALDRDARWGRARMRLSGPTP